MTSGEPVEITVTSGLFHDGQQIPLSAAHSSAGGSNISPDLRWGDLPSGTRSVAVTMYDPDAPTTVGFTHWVVFDLPADSRQLDAGAGTAGKKPAGSVLGFTDWGVSEYGGPAPPPGDDPHRYQITVFALDLPTLGVGATTTYALFNFVIRGHVLARGTLTGLFGH